MSYYIGVDGGGTKTAYALFDENKNMLSVVKTKGSNHENLEGSFEEACDILMEGITNLLLENKLKLCDIDGILMGLAGIDHQFQHDAMFSILSNQGLKNFEIYNDGFIVTKAGSPDGTGIGYNCGTGTCCNSIDSRGHMLQVGGFGELSGDSGNGYWIAERAFRIVYFDVVLQAQKSLLTKLFFEKFGVNDKDGVLSIIPKFENENTKDEICRGLTDIFFEASFMGDKPVLKVIDEMAETGSDFICAHLKQQVFDAEVVNVVLSGSMHVKLPNDIYVNALKAKCEAKSGRKLNFIKLNAAPVTGCINWLLESK